MRSDNKQNYPKAAKPQDNTRCGTMAAIRSEEPRARSQERGAKSAEPRARSQERGARSAVRKAHLDVVPRILKGFLRRSPGPIPAWGGAADRLSSDNKQKYPKAAKPQDYARRRSPRITQGDAKQRSPGNTPNLGIGGSQRGISHVKDARKYLNNALSDPGRGSKKKF